MSRSTAELFEDAMRLAAVSTLILGLLLFAGCQRVAPWPEAGVFAGYYQSGFEHSDFRPAGTRERWWLTGEIGPLRHPPAPNPAYIVVRGALSSKGRFGHLARYERELAVKDIIEVRTLTRDEILGVK